MTSKTKFDVYLTPHAIEQLKNTALYSMLVNGEYFLCTSIESTGNFFFMKFENYLEIEGYKTVEVSIPHNFVLFVLSFDTSTHPSL